MTLPKHRALADLAPRLRNRVQLTTDGHRPYIEAVEQAFGKDVDYAMVIKYYGTDPNEGRFSPPKVLEEEVRVIQGVPDPDRISTSYDERSNLTMRMGMRRFTRLTNAFSKKVENHAAAVALHFMYVNFGRPHKSLVNPYPRPCDGSRDRRPHLDLRGNRRAARLTGRYAPAVKTNVLYRGGT